MTAIKLVARNFIALGSGEVISRIITFAATVYLARVLGAEGYGVIVFAISVNLYLSKVADFSIEVIGTKELAKAPDVVSKLASAVMTVRITLAAILTGMAIFVTQMFVAEPERSIMSLFYLMLIPISANTKWIHLGLEKAGSIGLSRIVSESLSLGILLSIVRNKGDLWGAPLAQIAGEFCFAFMLVFVLRKRNYRFKIKWDLGTALPVFAQALPILGQNILWLIIYNSDLIFLRLFHDGISVGYYAAAYMLISFLANIGFSYSMSLLPTLTRLGAKTAGEKTLYQMAIMHVYMVCLPVSIGGHIMAPQLITFGFGEGYVHSIQALQVLIWCIPISLVRGVPWAALIARSKQDLILKAVMYSVILNIALNIVLIPLYGILGAGVATVITESFTGVLLFKYAVRQELPLISLQKLWRPTIASLFMAATLVILKLSSLWVGITFGVVIYSIALMALGRIRLDKGKLPALQI